LEKNPNLLSRCSCALSLSLCTCISTFLNP
jgi:hypothetical protein